MGETFDQILDHIQKQYVIAIECEILLLYDVKDSLYFFKGTYCFIF